MYWKFGLFILPLCSLALYGCGYTNYEECVLGEMKGQQASMQNTAEKVCERKFPYEKEIYSFRDGKFDIVWSESSLNSISIEIKNNETGYRLTKARMTFSTKTCDQSQYKDFNTDILFEFKSGRTATAYSSMSGEFRCMRKDSVFGIIK